MFPFEILHFVVCYVTDNLKLNLISLDWIEQLKLLEIPLKPVFKTYNLTSVFYIENHFRQLKNKFSDVFQDGLGCCTKIKATLKLKPDSKPILRQASTLCSSEYD